MLDKVRDLLNSFETITLAEMDSVKLMDRTDQKFIFHISRLPELLEKVKNDYRSLEVSGTRMSRYETLYFDTPEYKLFTQHHNGKTNRYKIRMRRYVESDLQFFEIKHKNNKGRTLKNRVKTAAEPGRIDPKASGLLHETAGMQPGELEPKLWVNYTRITLVNRFAEERLTIDLDMEVKDENGSRKFDTLVIVEAKQSKATDTAFVKLLKEQRIRQGGMSKYCIAVAELNENIRKNNFKEGLITLNKITTNDPNAA
ncbi:MAG: polyphosphate polymerase domain-containing protein [Bacteroidetes bacterium]|nr:polyphosphate polymerase domain-containing protein [Bacteroidota bacterium]